MHSTVQLDGRLGCQGTMLALLEPDVKPAHPGPSGCLCFSGAQTPLKAVPSIRLEPEQYKARKEQHVVAMANTPQNKAVRWRLEDGDILEQEKHSCFSHRHACPEEAEPSGRLAESTRSIVRGHQKWLNSRLTTEGRRKVV